MSTFPLNIFNSNPAKVVSSSLSKPPTTAFNQIRSPFITSSITTSANTVGVFVIGIKLSVDLLAAVKNSNCCIVAITIPP
jgi:hypothetical protein